MRQNIIPSAFRRVSLLGVLALAGTSLVLAPAALAGHTGGGGGGSHGGGGGHSSGGGGGSHSSGSGGGHFSGGGSHFSGSGGRTSGGSSYRGSVRGTGWVTHSSGTHYSTAGTRTAADHGRGGSGHPPGGGHNYGGGHYYGGHYWGYPGNWYSPFYWGWNSWGWGWGWGWAPYWSSWWWGGPWGGTTIYVAPGAADNGGARSGRYAVVKTDVTPEEAQVYLDNKYIGTADDFDGSPDYLYLGPGTYHLEFKLPSYQTYATDVEVSRGQQVRIAQDLKLEPGKSALDAFPPESKGTPLGRVFTKGGDAAAGAAPRGDDGWSDRDSAPAWREPAEGDRTDVRAMPPARPSSRARINFRVTPDDAAVYMDDKYLGAADDLAANTRGVVADPGTHSITVTRPGYKSRTVEVTAHAGGQPVDVVVELEK
jgi:hypothetical protein